MLRFVGLAGDEGCTAARRRCVCDDAGEGVSILEQMQRDRALSICRQTVAGFDGVVQCVAKNNAEIFRRDGQIFLHAQLARKTDAVVFCQRALGAENGIEGIVASVDGRAGALEMVADPGEILTAASEIARIEVAAQRSQLVVDVVAKSAQLILPENDLVHVFELGLHLLLGLFLIANDLVLTL